MDISQMRMMLVLADCKSITTTAKKLRVTQPALTYQLKVIENELGFKVFNRARTGTSLTVEGAFLHEKIRKIVADYDEAVRLARAMAKGSAAGTIRVGINDHSRDTISFYLSVTQSSLPFTLIPCGSSDPVKLLHERVIDFWSTSDISMRAFHICAKWDSSPSYKTRPPSVTSAIMFLSSLILSVKAMKNRLVF